MRILVRRGSCTKLAVPVTLPYTNGFGKHKQPHVLFFNAGTQVCPDTKMSMKEKSYKRKLVIAVLQAALYYLNPEGGI